MGTPLTPEEKSVMRVLSAGRPKRNLHVYALLAVGTFFLAMALWKAVSRSSDPASRVSERPGPKAAAQEPSPATLRELLQKQSISNTPAKAEDAAGAKTPTLRPPSDVMALDEASTAPGAVMPAMPERTRDVERKLVEASFMTAKTEMYVQAATGTAPVTSGTKEDSASPDVASPSRDATAGALSSALESSGLTRTPTGGKSVDERITARVREQDAFLAKSVRGLREPNRSVGHGELVVAEGTSIPAVLMRAITSELPGPVEAMVVSDVYDSTGSGRVMIPKGSHITGSYNSAVAVGQDRLQVVFTRLRLPSGATISMEAAPAADSLGRSGAPGEVDNHYVRMLGSAVVMGLITLAVERRVQRDNATTGGAVNVYGGSTGTPASATAQAFGNVTNQLLERNLGIGPTIAIAAGTRIRVQVVRDLAITPEAVS